jgi:hypothetical protein
MVEIMLIKRENGLMLADDYSTDTLEGVNVGTMLKCKIMSERSVGFHRKYFALLNFAFDKWEPKEVTFRGQIVAKNFDRFRSDVQILAGYGYPVVNLRQDVRYESKSISLGKMSQEDFEKLYSSLIDVILQKILTQYTRDDLDQVVNKLLLFA